MAKDDSDSGIVIHEFTAESPLALAALRMAHALHDPYQSFEMRLKREGRTSQPMPDTIQILGNPQTITPDNPTRVELRYEPGMFDEEGVDHKKENEKDIQKIQETAKHIEPKLAALQDVMASVTMKRGEVILRTLKDTKRSQTEVIPTADERMAQYASEINRIEGNVRDQLGVKFQAPSQAVEHERNNVYHHITINLRDRENQQALTSNRVGDRLKLSKGGKLRVLKQIYISFGSIFRFDA